MKQNHMRGPGSGAHLDPIEVRGKKFGDVDVTAFEMAAPPQTSPIYKRRTYKVEGGSVFKLHY